jgi:hypothetical protein
LYGSPVLRPPPISSFGQPLSAFCTPLTPSGLIARQDIYWTWEEALDALNDHADGLRATGLSG